MPLPIIAAIARGAAVLGRVAGQAVAAVGQGAAEAAATAQGAFARAAQAIAGAAPNVAAPPVFAQGALPVAQQVTGQQGGAFAQAAHHVVPQAGAAGGHIVPPLPPGPPPGQQSQQPAPWMPQGFNPGQLLNSGPSLTSIIQNIRTGNSTVDGVKDTVIALATLPSKLKDFGASVVEARRNLAEYNGDIANAMVQLEFDRFGRNVQLAASTSASTEGLTEAQSKLEERLLPYQAAGMNSLNQLVTVALRIADYAVQLSEATNGIQALLVRWFGKINADPKDQTLVELARDIASGNVWKRNMPPMPPKKGPK